MSKDRGALCNGVLRESLSEKVLSGPEAGFSVIGLGTTLRSHCPIQRSLATRSY